MDNMEYCRRYELLIPKHRKRIDLRVYEDVIRNAVRSVLDDVPVDVYEMYYDIKSTVSNGQARKIGRLISKNCKPLRECAKRRDATDSNPRKSVQIFKGKDVNEYAN